MITLNIIKDSDMEEVEIIGRKHLVVNLNPQKKKSTIYAKMHTLENSNNLEILKLKIWCEKNDTSLVLYGNINQLPLFSMFADQLILADFNNLDNLYDGSTCYKSLLTSSFGLTDLHRRANTVPIPWPSLLIKAWNSITTEEVVSRFKDVTIWVLRSSLDLYNRLSEKYPDHALITEVKRSHLRNLNQFENIFYKYSQIEQQLNLNLRNDILDFSFRKKLLFDCGGRYMSIQILFSFFKNWMWLCYGGASNIFCFFPVKTIGLYDDYLLEDLIRSISIARFREFGEILPVMNLDIFLNPSQFIDIVNSFRNVPIEVQLKEAKISRDNEFLKPIVINRKIF